jgi:hypothetical protein
MNLSDFMSQWSNVQICHLTAESFSDELIEDHHVNQFLNLKLNKF